MRVVQHSRRCIVILAALLSGAAVAAANGSDIRVEVRTDGDAIVVVVDCPVRATPAQAWDVLTDFDNMTRFLPHLDVSRAEMRGQSRLRVYQKGAASSGPFRFPFENVREIELTPFTLIRSRFVSGDLSASEYETELTETSTGVHIINRGRYVSNAFVPPVVGPLVIANETRRQFSMIRDEIMRRKAMPRSSID